MKKAFSRIAAIIAVFTLTVFISSCEKDEGKLPNISFKTTAGYTSADATVGQGDTLLIGINASKSEDKDVLKTFNASVKFDSAADSTFFNYTIPQAEEDSYTKDITIITRNQAGTEKYSFTVVNRDGLVNTVSLTLTVQ